jgi:cob(I)alamin adenosyltransferase
VSRGEILSLPEHRVVTRFSEPLCSTDEIRKLSPVRIYTRKGDDGTTGLLRGGRVHKTSPTIIALGDIDEAQAAIGVARSLASGELHAVLTNLARTLWTVMSAVAGSPDREAPSDDRFIEATRELESFIDDAIARFPMPTDFVIPGGNPLSGALDLARAVVRRAERSTLASSGPIAAVAYLNRLSDLLWALARLQEGETVLAKSPASN